MVSYSCSYNSIKSHWNSCNKCNHTFFSLMFLWKFSYKSMNETDFLIFPTLNLFTFLFQSYTSLILWFIVPFILRPLKNLYRLKWYVSLMVEFQENHLVLVFTSFNEHIISCFQYLFNICNKWIFYKYVSLFYFHIYCY